MHALVLEEFNGPFIPKEVATPRISSHEALVRVRNVGVCGTDLKIRAGRMGLNVLPLIMGDEVAGEVAEVGSEVRGVAPGDRVTVNFYVTCGHCQFCREGRDTLVPGRPPTRLQPGRGGRRVCENSWSQFVSRCQTMCHWNAPVSSPMRWRQSYHAVTKRAQVRPGKTVALVGGWRCRVACPADGQTGWGWVIAVDVNEARLDLAQKFGADAVVDARQGPFDQAIRQLTDGQGVDVVMEFVANHQTLPLSYRSLKRAGRLVFVGYTPELPMPVLPHELVRNEWEIVGARATTKQELQETMDLVAQGRIQPIIDRIFPLEDIELAFEALRQGNSLGRNVVAV